VTPRRRKVLPRRVKRTWQLAAAAAHQTPTALGNVVAADRQEVSDIVATTHSRSQPVAYRPMTLVDLAGHLAAADDERHRWRLVAEFLEEYRHEPDAERTALLADEPPNTGDERWDVFLAALAEHLATRDGRGAAAWAADRRLAVFWFPFDSAAARVDAVVHAPASFRSRGIFIAPEELGVA